MNRFFKTILILQTFMFAIATSVFADEACDDALSDGIAAYNSGNYTIAQKHFENVVKWCGNKYGDANNWVNKCQNVRTETKKSNPPKSFVTDCQGHSYPIVRIGSQYWMTENLQCTKYDTQSERAGVVLGTSQYYTYAPYYIDGRNATTEHSDGLTTIQRQKMGLLYNWAAAVGLISESEAKAQSTSFEGRRQGICPNGWHIPNHGEWETLRAYIEQVEHKVKNSAGKYLKSSSGWYKRGNGVDAYYFSILPAGCSAGERIQHVGTTAYFTSATPASVDNAYTPDFRYDYDGICVFDYEKGFAHSVRCVRN